MPEMTTRDGRVLVFDVLGTLLDEDAGQRRTTHAVLGLSPDAEQRFIAAWSVRIGELLKAIVEDGRPYRPQEDVAASAAADVAREQIGDVPAEAIDRLARFGRALDPFPEVPAALDALAGRHALVGLTNAGFAQAFAMSRHAGLRWTTLLSGQAVQSFKPDPRVYRHAISVLELDPERSVFVAAHPWDLDGAAREGFRTAFVARGGEGAGAAYDYAAPDLAALVPLLTDSEPRRS
jgi:2-haloacid dehalogenase